MTAPWFEHARLLLQKADIDLESSAILLQHKGAAEAVCFHVQQAAEKILKALLSAKDAEYPVTHDLKALLDEVLPFFPELQPFVEVLPEYSPYAVRLRYEDLMVPTREDAQAALAEVSKLRKLVSKLLPPEAIPAQTPLP